MERYLIKFQWFRYLKKFKNRTDCGTALSVNHYFFHKFKSGLINIEYLESILFNVLQPASVPPLN